MDRVFSGLSASGSHGRTGQLCSQQSRHRTRFRAAEAAHRKSSPFKPWRHSNASKFKAVSAQKQTVQGPQSKAVCSTEEQSRIDHAQEPGSPAHESSDPDPATAEPAPFFLTMESSSEEEADASSQNSNTTALASVVAVGGVAFLLGAGVLFKDQIVVFLDFFIHAVDEWGFLGYIAYALVYMGLEVLAVPAIPLTMTAGVILGPVNGTILTSIAATGAATIAFLITRYAARRQVMQWAARNRKFAAIDKAIGRDGLKFVTLLRLSPLLPLAASNYLYGLTSVDLGSYVLGSFIGMLPGTYAYVYAGYLGKAVFLEGEGSLSVSPWQVGLGIAVTVLALGFVGQLAKNAISEIEEEDKAK